ncbi:MAG: 2-hydroxyglutaryl-CoA dehydratase [Deltaproteobacteria bacterium]|nr:2-hydroxyglutaryl-CoA dehydratase [Deltaproteobacteria bacterium]
MSYAVGVDVGSTQTKAIVIDEEGRIAGRSLIDTGANVMAAAENAFVAAIRGGGIAEEDVAFVIGTGYGRYKVTFGDAQVTEISCHARGAVHMFPATRTVLDMGGQDTKAIRVHSNGEVADFCMNDKCAAGTGRFLQAAAFALEIPLDELGATAMRSDRPVPITTTCTVFAESEVLSWLARGKKIADILRGVHHSIGTRSMGLLRRVGLDPEVTFTGGVSRNSCMVEVLNEMIGAPLNVSEESHFMGALGAALIALDHARSRQSPPRRSRGEAAAAREAGR